MSGLRKAGGILGIVAGALGIPMTILFLIIGAMGNAANYQATYSLGATFIAITGFIGSVGMLTLGILALRVKEKIAIGVLMILSSLLAILGSILCFGGIQILGILSGIFILCAPKEK